MNTDISFTLTNRLIQNTGQSVLVYMVPIADRTQTDLFLAAWQVLNPSANGGSQRFRFRGNFQLAVEDEATSCRSAVMDVQPNQLYIATNSDNQGPALQIAYSQGPPSAKQVAVLNQTDPAVELTAVWYMDGQPIALQRGLNLSTMATFQYSTAFYFVVATPKIRGLEQTSEEFRYLVPADDEFKAVSSKSLYEVTPGVRQVNIRWMRPGGLSGSDVLIFDPPTAR